MDNLKYLIINFNVRWIKSFALVIFLWASVLLCKWLLVWIERYLFEFYPIWDWHWFKRCFLSIFYFNVEEGMFK